MRQNLSRGMVVASAATSILSLYAIPAFASSHTEAAPVGPLGGAYGHALPDVPVADAEANCAESLQLSVAPDLSTDKSCNTGTSAPAAHGADHSDSRRQGVGSSRNGHSGAAGYGDGDTADDVPVAADGSSTAGSVPVPSRSGGPDGGLLGHGHGGGLDGGLLGQGHGGGLDGGLLGQGHGGGLDGGLLGQGHGHANAASGVNVHGGDEGYGDTPSTPPATTPPASPPVGTPPTKTPPATVPPTTPPASTPAQPPSLPNTGAGDLTFMASGAAALLMTGGVILYRRGRTGARR
ncbi:LPXTG cell wall anchor domain-containing protein [Streptomyces sp. NPDC014006]|uniref:LPXTG cell wall anchor domain-containing protein n=1 Tax=Streptomyces sp. NPDC014006 TaxID=3364870 RepID=UPI0037009DC8